MFKLYKNIYYEIEDRHWWNVSRRGIIIKLINPLLKNGMKILDIGCASGSLIDQISTIKNVQAYGIDISSQAIKMSESKGIMNVKTMDASRLNFKDNQFDIIIASDVLEHIKDDKSALLEWKRVLKKNGYLIIFVPAHMALWSQNDIYSEHFRRYDKYQFKARLSELGVNILRLSYWNVILFIPIFIFRKVQNIFTKETQYKYQLRKTHPFIDQLLKMILYFENRVIEKINLPIGVSLFAICKKK